jgi:signal transduction histidine kinase
MGTLAGGIAHDFNNLLYAIIGYAEMSREDVSKDSLTYKNLGKVLDACQRGQELISRILAFSRRQHHQFEPIDLKANVEAALALLRPTIPASVIVQFQSNISPNILGNKTQIHQVLVNLINNAVDAMDGEGTINIELSEIKSGDPYLKQVPETLNQNYCKIDIIDTGHGMDQHTMERIFEPFFTTKEVGKGTGLGLSIVHSIIKEHQGEITVQSQLGHGTTFSILLPEHSVQ